MREVWTGRSGEDNGGLVRPSSAIVSVVKHLYKFFYTLFFLSTQEFHVNKNMLNYYVFKCIPCTYDNINKENHMYVVKK